jgi:hypothetical protein
MHQQVKKEECHFNTTCWKAILKAGTSRETNTSVLWNHDDLQSDQSYLSLGVARRKLGRTMQLTAKDNDVSLRFNRVPLIFMCVHEKSSLANLIERCNNNNML